VSEYTPEITLAKAITVAPGREHDHRVQGQGGTLRKNGFLDGFGVLISSAPATK